MPEITLQKFIERHKPSAGVKKPEQALIDRYRGLLPASLLELWQTVGFGPYSDGLLQLINPDIYKNILYGWLMYEQEDLSRLPIALSAFGTMFYFRKLSEEDDEEEAVDVAMVDPHNSTTEVLAWSVEDFFNKFLCDDQNVSWALQESLFRQAIQKHGSLEDQQIYYYVPALRLGGAMHVDAIERGDAVVHLDILLQLALDS